LFFRAPVENSSLGKRTAKQAAKRANMQQISNVDPLERPPIDCSSENAQKISNLLVLFPWKFTN
jgi:hypothetical protein